MHPFWFPKNISSPPFSQICRRFGCTSQRAHFNYIRFIAFVNKLLVYFVILKNNIQRTSNRLSVLSIEFINANNRNLFVNSLVDL